jgi:hypothetical protein
MGEVISLARERNRRRTEFSPMGAPLGESGRVHDVRRVGPTPAGAREPLWREVAGDVLRQERRHQGRTLADVAGRAGMSVQHLSEVERGRKEASSEMLAAAAGSLGLNLAEFTRRCAGVLAPAGAPTGPVLLAA